MQVTVSAQTLTPVLPDLLEGLSKLDNASLLTGIELTAVQNALYLASTDTESYLRIKIPATVTTPGTLLVPGRVWATVIQKMPPTDITFATTPTGSLQVLYPHGRITLQLLPDGKLPPFPTNHVPAITIPGAQLIDLYRRIAFNCATDETRAILQGIAGTPHDQHIEWSATNGARAGFHRTLMPDPLPDSLHDNTTATWVIPPGVLRRLLHLNPITPIQLQFGPQFVTFQAENFVLHARILSGEYPDLSHVFPEEYCTTITTDRKELISAIERLQVLSDKHHMPSIECHLTPPTGALTIQANDNTAEEWIDGTILGRDLTLTLNPRYLLDAAKACTSDLIAIRCSGPQSALLIHNLPEDPLQFIVLPQRPILT